jgi:hypothetical protein
MNTLGRFALSQRSRGFIAWPLAGLFLLILSSTTSIYVIHFRVAAQVRAVVWQCVRLRQFQAESRVIMAHIGIVFDQVSQIAITDKSGCAHRLVVDAIGKMAGRNHHAFDCFVCWIGSGIHDLIAAYSFFLDPRFNGKMTKIVKKHAWISEGRMSLVGVPKKIFSNHDDRACGPLKLRLVSFQQTERDDRVSDNSDQHCNFKPYLYAIAMLFSYVVAFGFGHYALTGLHFGNRTVPQFLCGLVGCIVFSLLATYFLLAL